ncbi:tetratricopeptide repeat protein 39A [Eurytemora carolleeae]|uniref:tetratricopeptide repeat protein 39A n=1 Tax=Eurytemora carolleeae TaxID=1294199 RepID=UPI000C779B61|nr:tetratricopeptide repeat protein 39A [Eurytemora carolleeae]|eukprot:XP_023326849.1 tetratricopeptide repeat protein 39A-like [Eurytemora affinis]
MTFEQEHVETASKVLSQSVATINGFRRKSGLGESIGKMVKGKDYNDMTETEVHAELVYAECLLLKALLTIVEDENLVSFVKAGLKVRQCYLSFRECWTILQRRDWSKDEFKSHFEGGVRLGVGTFNLMMSLLPTRITKLMEFVGFAGSKEPSEEIGMTEMLSCYRNPACLRQFLASIILLGYHLFLTTNMGKPNECDKRLVEEILEEKLAKYPTGAFFLFFKGRYEMISGRCEAASVWYTRANNSQVSWPQFQHVGSWELLWSACYRGEWREAEVQADRLLRESRWSPCIYAFFKAVLICQLGDEETSTTCFYSYPNCCPSCPRNGRLLLPGLELVYLWHGFSVIGDQRHILERFHTLIEETEKQVGNLSPEDKGLLELLRSMCLKNLGFPLQAEEGLRKVMSLSSQFTLDKYLAPYATFELALLLLDQENSDSQMMKEGLSIVDLKDKDVNPLI